MRRSPIFRIVIQWQRPGPGTIADTLFLCRYSSLMGSIRSHSRMVKRVASSPRRRRR